MFVDTMSLTPVIVVCLLITASCWKTPYRSSLPLDQLDRVAALDTSGCGVLQRELLVLNLDTWRTLHSLRSPSLAAAHEIGLQHRRRRRRMGMGMGEQE